jgi:hypothetical protein
LDDRIIDSQEFGNTVLDGSRGKIVHGLTVVCWGVENPTMSKPMSTRAAPTQEAMGKSSFNMRTARTEATIGSSVVNITTVIGLKDTSA